jgi:hypothetical protein
LCSSSGVGGGGVSSPSTISTLLYDPLAADPEPPVALEAAAAAKVSAVGEADRVDGPSSSAASFEQACTFASARSQSVCECGEDPYSQTENSPGCSSALDVPAVVPIRFGGDESTTKMGPALLEGMLVVAFDSDLDREVTVKLGLSGGGSTPPCSEADWVRSLAAALAGERSDSSGWVGGGKDSCLCGGRIGPCLLVVEGGMVGVQSAPDALLG